ncbi:AraC family transcriptional regulator [Vibrio sp. 99-70-13A1]|uniref:AraC family transcriptional regulator n=1 Tax=Vibrio sp. 99-70-13A1 TaxID=2607601 RepID=UPI00149352A8|nr:AraC family transcriptional regulator [Vibrio sp. 99-70-13A1]NOH96373.1 AraC family transcriptional regulator [Vibrio sp. 99-70-13A1]
MAKDNSVAFKQSSLLPQIEIRVASDSKACYEAHSHDEFSFGIINSGQAAYTNLGSQHSIGANDVVTINPADVHSCNPEQGHWSYSMLFVDSLWMGKVQQQILDSTSHDYFAFENDFERRTDLQRQFQALYRSLICGESALEAEYQLFEFIRKGFTLSTKSKNSKVFTAPHLSRVKEKLIDNLDSNLSLTDLSQEIGVSQYHLIRTFKQYYGLSPHAYLLDERIKRAKEMLKTGQTIVDTSNQLGFSDQAHFQRNFKKRTAVTPRLYQSFFQ